MSYLIDQKNCTCCHRCKVECPAGAVRFKNHKYWIDPEKCTDCGHCVEVCHNGIITNPDMPNPMPVPHERAEKVCDVVVIGGGGAGMTAAARAASLGAKVIVLEKGHEVGGSAWYAHMFRTHYSKWHKEAGLPDERDKVYEQFMKKTEGKVNEKLVRRILDSNVRMVDWLIEEHDLGKDYVLGHGPFGSMGLIGTYLEEYNTKRIDTAIGPGGTGWYMVLKMKKILEANGGEILYKTAGKELFTDAAGRVTGVLAKDPGGDVMISCKACIVAAGAFTRNREIMDRMQPLFYNDAGNEPVHIFTHSMCTGDGITMCEKIGADIDYVNRRVNLFGPGHHPYPCCSLTASRCSSGVMVNNNGKLLEVRFEMNEVGMLAKEPGRSCWLILDSKAIEDEINRNIGGQKDVVGIPLDDIYRNWRQELAEEEEQGGCISAESLEKLGEKLGFDPYNFASMIREHNKNLGMKDGATPPFGDLPDSPPGGKPSGDAPDDIPEMFFGMPPPPPAEPLETPPYYAFFMKLFHENAVGGMTIDENMNVLKQGRPIPGLYAAGDNTRGIMLPGKVGVAYIEGVISALTFALNSGFTAGEEAARLAKG